ncbi:hypothetical protein OFN56_34980, partial [Escherichia coli]|nr:hypothetical protein [Escherichia coli]
SNAIKWERRERHQPNKQWYQCWNNVFEIRAHSTTSLPEMVSQTHLAFGTLLPAAKPKLSDCF